jgi:hypothetical protein
LYENYNVRSVNGLINSISDKTGKEHSHSWMTVDSKNDKKWFDDEFGTKNGAGNRTDITPHKKKVKEMPTKPYRTDVSVDLLDRNNFFVLKVEDFFEKIKLNVNVKIDSFYIFFEFDSGINTEIIISYPPKPNR